MKKVLYLLLFVLNLQCQGQVSECTDVMVTSTINPDCGLQKFSYAGMTFNYPRLVEDAVKEHSLEYLPNGVFFKYVADTTLVRKRFRIELLYSDVAGSHWKDNNPASVFEKALVKGYTFWYSEPLNNIKTKVEQQLGVTFIPKKKVELGTKNELTYWFAEVDKCVRLTIVSNGSSTRFTIHFDRSEEEITKGRTF